MADDDPSDFNSAFTAFGDPNPVGTTTAIGNTAQNPNDPLIDWASNLSKDDLARFLHDPQGSASDMAARGIPPPPVDRIHDHNDAMGTPSRSQRFDTQPASPLDQSQIYRINPTTGKLYNLTSAANNPPAQQVTQSGQAAGMMGAPQMPASASGFAGTEAGDAGDTAWDQGLGQPPAAPNPNSPIARFNRWRNPNDPNNLPAPAAPAPAANPAYTGGGALAGPQQGAGGIGGAQPAIGQAAAATTPTPQEDTKAEEKSPSEKVGKALSDLGKAMQGVKAPEPLKPPGFAPAPHGPTSAGASPIAGLLQALSRTQTGQVPPSVMPLLRLIGRA